MTHKHISSLSQHISNHFDTLTHLEKGILTDLTKNSQKFTYDNFTIAYIADVLSVSTTSLHRLSKKLGYPSFTLFKEDYFANYNQSNEPNPKHHYLEMISNTYRLVYESLSEAMLRELLKAKKITIYGMGMSSYIAKIFEIKLNLNGIPTQFFDDSRFMKLSSQSLSKETDVVLVLSRSGCPPELIDAMVEVDKREVPSILITEVEHSPIEMMATYVVHTSYALDSDYNIDTRINTHIALDIIVEELLRRKKDEKNDL